MFTPGSTEGAYRVFSSLAVPHIHNLEVAQMVVSGFSSCFKRVLFIGALLAAAPATSALTAQPPGNCVAQSEPYVLHITAHEVVLDVIATDSHGRPVRDLAANELMIYELPKGDRKSVV